MTRVRMLLTTLILLSALVLKVAPVQAGPQLNKYLPSVLKADLEYRYRVEYRQNYDFSDARDDEDAFHLGRTRLTLKYNPIKELGLFFQGQDSRISEANTVNKALFENYLDIRQLYVDYTDNVVFEPVQLNKLSARVGRQEFSYGAQRLIGGFNWSNVAQTFDGAKVGFHFVPGHIQLDIFGGDKTQNKSPREFDDFYDGSSRERFYGYYATAKVFGETFLDQYLFRRETDRNISFGPSGSGQVDNYTAGGRIKKAFRNGWDIEGEAAGQWGEFRGKDVRAGMAAGQVGYTFNNLGWKPRASFEYVYGSGDEDATDDELNTFDNLYPTNHLFYGNIDFASLQNMNHIHYQLTAKPHKKVKLQADWRMLFLAEVRDSYYSVARAVVRTATRDVDDHLGNEIDLTADFKLNDYIALQAGYSHFFAGDYLADTGANDDADFVYFQTTFSL